MSDEHEWSPTKSRFMLRTDLIGGTPLDVEQPEEGWHLIEVKTVTNALGATLLQTLWEHRWCMGCYMTLDRCMCERLGK